MPAPARSESSANRNRRRPIGIPELVAGLAADIEAVCHRLLPKGRVEGGAEWVVRAEDSHFGCSVSVHLRGGKRGIWKAWAAGLAGDALDLVACVACDGDKGRAVAWAIAWLGNQPVADPEARARRESAARREAIEDRGRRSMAADRMWLAAQPSLKGTPAERYLARRGIDLGLLGRQPRALRFHPGLWDDGMQGRHWPALVANINTPDGAGAVHRIWLTPEGEKAPLFDRDGNSQAKRSFGPKRGGIVPLWRGASKRPLREAPAGSTLWISEGIEDGLAIAILTGGAERVVAAIDLGNMALVTLPPAISTVVIVGQNDAWFSDAQQRAHGTRVGLDNAIRHFQAEGRQVSVWRSELPGCKDANDHLRALARAGNRETA